MGMGPKPKAAEITRQFADLTQAADRVRLARLAELDRVRIAKGPRVPWYMRIRGGQDPSQVPSDDEEGDPFTLHDRHDFRRLAHEAPGRIFTTLIADARTSLGQTMIEGETGAGSALFQKWLAHHFKPAVGSRLNTKDAAEFDFLVKLLDELSNGRTLEAADLVAAKFSANAFGVQTGNWELANELLAFKPREFALSSNETIDRALQLAKKRIQREADMRAVSAGSRARTVR